MIDISTTSVGLHGPTLRSYSPVTVCNYNPGVFVAVALTAGQTETICYLRDAETARAIAEAFAEAAAHLEEVRPLAMVLPGR